MVELQGAELKCANCRFFSRGVVQELPLGAPDLLHGRCSFELKDPEAGKPEGAPKDWPLVTEHERCEALRPAAVIEDKKASQ